MNITELQHNSYAPYSDQPYPRMAVVQGQDDKWFPGVRIENISFPLTISAVQNALFCCLSEGQEPSKIFVEDQSESGSVLQYWKEEKKLQAGTLDELGKISFANIVETIKDDEIRQRLNELLKHSRAEHSDFPVSALVETKQGFIAGINIETGDWSRGLCAERVALAKAVSYGITDFEALHICTRDGEYNSPCGACRQVIIEHLPHHPVYLYHADGTKAMHFTSDLLPYSFQSSTLKVNPNR